jgi:hypothetical protein
MNVLFEPYVFCLGEELRGDFCSSFPYLDRNPKLRPPHCKPRTALPLRYGGNDRSQLVTLKCFPLSHSPIHRPRQHCRLSCQHAARAVFDSSDSPGTRARPSLCSRAGLVQVEHKKARACISTTTSCSTPSPCGSYTDAHCRRRLVIRPHVPRSH